MFQPMPEVYPYDVEKYLGRKVRGIFMQLKKANLKSIICHLKATFPVQARWNRTPSSRATRKELQDFFQTEVLPCAESILAENDARGRATDVSLFLAPSLGRPTCLVCGCISSWRLGEKLTFLNSGSPRVHRQRHRRHNTLRRGDQRSSGPHARCQYLCLPFKVVGFATRTGPQPPGSLQNRLR
jgi:hypothetical protein